MVAYLSKAIGSDSDNTSNSSVLGVGKAVSVGSSGRFWRVVRSGSVPMLSDFDRCAKYAHYHCLFLGMGNIYTEVNSYQVRITSLSLF